MSMLAEKEHAHKLIEHLGPGQVAAVVHLLEVMVHDDDDGLAEDELTEDDRRAVAASREYFRKGGEGVPFEQVVADCGFTMEQIRGSQSA